MKIVRDKISKKRFSKKELPVTGTTYQHKELAAGRWQKLSFVEQMANVGSEVERTMSWRKKGDQSYSQAAFFRALELLDLTIKAWVKSPTKLRELTRLREVLVDYFHGDNLYISSDKLWHNYFYAFNYAAALARQNVDSL